MDYYGNYETGDGYPLAAWVWGHRMRVGQHWMEYLLEFLNVLAGFGYKLGAGISDGTKYTRFTRLGLRRFVFYDNREKTRHPYDDQARELLWEALRDQDLVTAIDNGEDALDLARTLLRSFSAIEETRSWYAKSLFPVHHNLLFWEALRKGATKKTVTISQGIPPMLLDREISYDARNFFARGGELYYLILSAGTETYPERRRFIAERLKLLLTNHNQAVGNLAAIVERIWNEKIGEVDHEKKGELGWIPNPFCPLYVNMAEDVERFLQASLDPLECLYLLAHLTSFHLSLYIYFRAHPEAVNGKVSNGNFYKVCRPTLLIDAMEGADGGVVRNVSATIFREQEQRQIHAGRFYVGQTLSNFAAKLSANDDFVRNLQSDTDAHFSISRLSTRKRNIYQREVDQLEQRLQQNEINQQEFLEQYAGALFNTLEDDFRKNFLGVHRKLTKAIGFVAPRKGQNARFVLEDNLLKTLVLANVTPNKPITYDQFLDRLYQRYGFVIGPIEARTSDLFNRQRINAEYYDRNKEALLLKMQRAGLAVAYSDATAMVKH